MPLRRLLPSPLRRLGRRFIPGRMPSYEYAQLQQSIANLDRRVRLVHETLGQLAARDLRRHPPRTLHDAEFRIYSQWGEDGIIQYLVSQIDIPRPLFMEFGVESFQQANCRFLMIHDNWAGLVIDGDERNVAAIRRSREYWLHNLKAVHAFVTRDNINDLLRDNGVTGEIGLLSIDIDGMDYWVWEAIDVINPAIVVAEYNCRFGPDDVVTVPYDPAFDRRKAHHSLIYYGASLAALHRLAEQKGYALVGCGSAGLNAFFVRNDLRPASLPALTPQQAFRTGQFCEVHDADGNRIRMSHEQQMRLVRDLPLVHTDNGQAPGNGDARAPSQAGRGRSERR